MVSIRTFLLVAGMYMSTGGLVYGYQYTVFNTLPRQVLVCFSLHPGHYRIPPGASITFSTAAADLAGTMSVYERNIAGVEAAIDDLHAMQADPNGIMADPAFQNRIEKDRHTIAYTDHVSMPHNVWDFVFVISPGDNNTVKATPYPSKEAAYKAQAL